MHLPWKNRPVLNRKISEDSGPIEDKKEGLIFFPPSNFLCELLALKRKGEPLALQLFQFTSIFSKAHPILFYGLLHYWELWHFSL